MRCCNTLVIEVYFVSHVYLGIIYVYKCINEKLCVGACVRACVHVCVFYLFMNSIEEELRVSYNFYYWNLNTKQKPHAQKMQNKPESNVKEILIKDFTMLPSDSGSYSGFFSPLSLRSMCGVRHIVCRLLLRTQAAASS